MGAAIIISVWVAFALWTWKIGYQRGHAYAGFVLGFTVPVLGTAAIWLFPRSPAHSHELPTAAQQVAWLRNRYYSTGGGKHAA